MRSWSAWLLDGATLAEDRPIPQERSIFRKKNRDNSIAINLQFPLAIASNKSSIVLVGCTGCGRMQTRKSQRSDRFTRTISRRCH